MITPHTQGYMYPKETAMTCQGLANSMAPLPEYPLLKGNQNEYGRFCPDQISSLALQTQIHAVHVHTSDLRSILCNVIVH